MPSHISSTITVLRNKRVATLVACFSICSLRSLPAIFHCWTEGNAKVWLRHKIIINGTLPVLLLFIYLLQFLEMLIAWGGFLFQKVRFESQTLWGWQSNQWVIEQLDRSLLMLLAILRFREREIPSIWPGSPKRGLKKAGCWDTLTLDHTMY